MKKLRVAIDKQGRWLLNDISLLEGKKSLPVFKDAPKVVLAPNPAGTAGDSALICLGESGETRGIDVVFPVMHGPLCEDGTIQGLLELADLPYWMRRARIGRRDGQGYGETHRS